MQEWAFLGSEPLHNEVERKRRLLEAPSYLSHKQQADFYGDSPTSGFFIPLLRQPLAGQESSGRTRLFEAICPSPDPGEAASRRKLCAERLSELGRAWARGESLTPFAAKPG